MKNLVRLFIVAWLAPILFFGCGGDKKLVGDYITNGVEVSYAPAVGKTIYLRSDTDDHTEFTKSGYHESTLSKSTAYEAFTVNSVANDTTSVTYRFLYDETGIFKDSGYELVDEESELIGQALTIVVGPDGKLVDWSGLEDLEPDESGIDRGEMMASNYASIFFDHFPTEPIKVGSVWERVNSMDVSTKDGDMHQQTTKTYTVVDFVERDGYPCVKCKIKIVIDNTGEGVFEAEGKMYDYYNEGRGEGNGIVYFAFEAGHPVYSTFNWIVEFKITSVEQETQEENVFTYFQDQKVSYSLVDESDVPE
ncbi:hypothetical protein DRQ36_00420 [bacterium]|nr:MAG: hypothetical protein DRQ36_00420 [bacterium]